MRARSLSIVAQKTPLPCTNCPPSSTTATSGACRLAMALLGLADAILCDELETRLELLERTVLSDPALALWSVTFAWRGPQQAIESASAAAGWLDRADWKKSAGRSKRRPEKWMRRAGWIVFA